MEYQALIQPAISVILAIISGLWSYIASKANNKAEIEKQSKEHSHIVEKLEKEFQHQIDTLKQQHAFDLEKVKQAHELRLQELEKVSQLDAETDKAMKVNDLAYKVLAGEVDFDRALKIANKASDNKQNLKKRFIQKTSKKS